jgi:hypothetical protein
MVKDMSNLPNDLTADSFNRAHDEHDAERTVYPVKRSDDGAFEVLRKSVEDEKRLRKIETQVLEPSRP